MKILTVDVGSTYTKLTAIDSERHEILSTAQSFTTIETDVMVGFENAFRLLTEERTDNPCAGFKYDQLLVCSSAAGGLKMVALGLVPDLTAKAARTAASNAGAKVMKTYAYEISGDEEREIYDINPDLVLLCGGTDGGNKEVIIANAKRLCNIDRDFTTIVAGNKSATDEIREIFTEAGKSFVITENVMPEFNRLNIEPARDAIRNMFISRIIEAKGLNRLQSMTPHKIIPTPLAVLQACELLSKGTDTQEGVGDLLAVDIGGATTDVYSMASGEPTVDSTMTKGLPEPWSKRTVEGDLGMRYSLRHVFEQLNVAPQPTTIPVEKVGAWVDLCSEKPDTLAMPDSEEEKIEEYLGRTAVAIAVERHCGRMEDVYTPFGLMHTLEGKDLMNVPMVIGIGGVVRNSRHPKEILKGSLYDVRHAGCTKPRSPKFYLDQRYIYAAMGLLSMTDRELAFELIKKETVEIDK
ncbi:MAG: glutamate mutase L [Prevotella sp.]|nr:glutamate mutase L [Prevotella sp.]